MAPATKLDVGHRIDFVYLFDVRNGNPNGDPDAGNAPRMDAETGHGLVSDVCLKRKIRYYVAAAKAGVPRYDIYVKVHSALHERRAEAYKKLELKVDSKSASDAERARKWMCEQFFDVRTFGAVMSMKEFNCGQVRGPLQLTFAESVDVIADLEQCIVRKAVEKEDMEKQLKKDGMITGTMGRKSIVPYGLYRTHLFFNPPFAEDTGFTNEDLELTIEALKKMFDLDRSAARGEMSARKLFAFEHASRLGNAPASHLFERIAVGLKDSSRPPRRFSDYEVVVNRDGLPEGVTLHELL